MASVDDMGDNPDWTAGIAERKIQDVIDEGLFDDLPGRGQPLDLSVNPFEPPGMGAVNRLLKHNRVLPPWLLLEQEIEASRALALASLARWEASEPGLRETGDYPRLRASAREAYARHLKQTNDLILKYNYSSPFAFRAPIPFMLKRRLQEFDEQYGAEEVTAR
jgi:DnaJ family protein C protein 28